MKTDCYLFIVQILQRFLPAALPDLHLPRLGDVGLPVDDSPLTPAPTRWQRVKVERLVIRGAFYRAEHAAEFLPRPGGAVGAHVLEEGWHFPGGRHALSGWSVGGKKHGVQPLLLIVSACAAAAFQSAGGRTTAQRTSSRMLQKQSLCHLSDNIGTAYCLSCYKQTVWNCLLMSLNEPAASSWFHSSASKERETSCLWKQRSSIGNRRRMFPGDGITSGTPRRPLLSRVKPQLSKHQGTDVAQLCLRGLTDGAFLTPKFEAITQSAPRRVPPKSHPFRRRRALSVQHHTLLILSCSCQKSPTLRCEMTHETVNNQHLGLFSGLICSINRPCCT